MLHEALIKHLEKQVKAEQDRKLIIICAIVGGAFGLLLHGIIF